MQQCPFCGTKWSGSGPCPGCGLEPETPRDDSMFRPPEDGGKPIQEVSPEFDVEKILRWEPSPEGSNSQAEEAPEGEAAPLEDESDEEGETLKKPLKRWQKLVMAAVAVVVAAALVIRLWPQTPALPEDPAFFVQDKTLMMLPVGGEPQKVTGYTVELENYLQISPDHKSIAWKEPGVSIARLLPAAGEEIKSWEKRYAESTRFSQDGKYLYLSMADDEDEDVRALWRYEIASGEEEKIGPLYWDYFVENGTLAAVYDGTNLTVYDVETKDQKWTQEIDLRWMQFFDDRLYFAQFGANNSQLCCWQNGQVEVLLENIDCLYTRDDGAVYIQCYQDDSVPAAEMMKNDLGGADGQEMMQELEKMEIHSPGRTLYCFDGQELHPLGENKRLYFFPYVEQNAAICSMEYPSAEEVKGTFNLSELYDIWVEQGSIVQSQLDSLWPYEASLDYVAVKGKLFRLPEGVPQEPYTMQIEGDWVCFYAMEENILWVGKIEGENVVSKDSFVFQETMNFTMRPEGNLYYWGTNSIGPLFENGVPISAQAYLPSIQCTSDGAIYFLEGSGYAFTLHRVYQGKQEQLAENVKDCTGYTRDYATFLQYRDEESDIVDLFTYTAGKGTSLAAEEVQDLLPVVIQQDDPQFDYSMVTSYRVPLGYIDMNF